MSYQWLRNGRPIGDADGRDLHPHHGRLHQGHLAARDGKQAVLHGRRPRSATRSPSLLAAPSRTSASPTISGSAAPGGSLSVTAGSWSPAANKFRYQWLRQGAPIPGPPARATRLTADDAGRDVSVTVFASTTGFNDGATTTRRGGGRPDEVHRHRRLKASRVKLKKAAKLGITRHGVAAWRPRPASSRCSTRARRSRPFTMAPVHKGKKTLKLQEAQEGQAQAAGRLPRQRPGLRLEVEEDHPLRREVTRPHAGHGGE